eukprot:gnl/MRDRNA2_/MRDRNA2_130562_c0_seq1.p1 gnl/MRDRNA2_/MRDRNA2_130562_c0~~gnl/MRDRNA2_/MRDRNA2_130562_c0_seq1.p1  ORF type:complete len:459 (+),score=76.94 gnl/MRDRNA2_/MRDRNA2_130562_c0_seq1:66-1442(+)
MKNIITVILLSFISGAHFRELVNHSSIRLDSVDEFVNNVVNKLFNQMLYSTSQQIRRTTGHLASKSLDMNLRSFLSFPAFDATLRHFGTQPMAMRQKEAVASERWNFPKYMEGTINSLRKVAEGQTTETVPSVSEVSAKQLQQTKCILQHCFLQIGKCAIWDPQCRAFVGCAKDHCAPEVLARAGFTKQIDIDACRARCQMGTIQYPDNMAFGELTSCMLDHNCIEPLANNLPVSQEMWTAEKIPPEALVTWSGELDAGSQPHPDYGANLNFDPVQVFSGKERHGKTWYITRGLHPIFDLLRNQQFRCVPCEDGSVGLTMDFDVPEKFPWGDEPTARIMKHQRVINQRLIPRVDNPAHLNLIVTSEYSARDDWYVVGANVTGQDDTDYIFVVHMGSNDAWKGYGGAFLLTPTTRQVLPKLESHLREVAKRANINWLDMKEPIADDMMISNQGLQAAGP